MERPLSPLKQTIKGALGDGPADLKELGLFRPAKQIAVTGLQMVTKATGQRIGTKPAFPRGDRFHAQGRAGRLYGSFKEPVHIGDLGHDPKAPKNGEGRGENLMPQGGH